MVETTNLAGGAGEPMVESPRMSTRSIWGKNAPEHYLPRVKNINEVKIIFFSYLSAFFQNLKILCLFSPLYLEMYAPNSLFCRFNLILISNMQDRQRSFQKWFFISFSWKWSYFTLKARYLATFSLSHLLLTHQHFCSLGKNCIKKPKTRKNPKKYFLIVFPTEWRFAFSYSVNNFEKDSECFCLTFVLIKPISKWDRLSLYKFHPR